MLMIIHYLMMNITKIINWHVMAHKTQLFTQFPTVCVVLWFLTDLDVYLWFFLFSEQFNGWLIHFSSTVFFWKPHETCEPKIPSYSFMNANQMDMNFQSDFSVLSMCAFGSCYISILRRWLRTQNEFDRKLKMTTKRSHNQ